MDATMLKRQKFSSSVKPFGLRDKISYMMGDFGCNCSFALISSYFMLFYVTVLGINPIHYGIIILITKVWDGINDPIIGALTDMLKPKDGQDKFRPWIKYTALPMAIVTAVMFLYIPGMPYWAKLLQCIITYILWDTFYTCINVPYGSLQSVITAKPVERAELSRFRTLGAMLAQLPIGIILPMILFVGADPVGSRFTGTGIFLGALSFLAFITLYKNTTERIKATPQENEVKFNYFKTFVSFFKNRPMVALTISTVATLMLTYSTSVLNQYVFMVYFKQPKLLSLSMLISLAPTIFAMVFVKAFVKKWGKKTLCSWPFLGAVAAYAALMILPISNPYLWFTLQGVAALFTGFNAMLTWALVADCIDYQEFQTGRREEGSIYATYSLFRKFAQGFGASLIAFLIGFTGYQASLGADQAAGVAEGIKFLACLLPLIGNVISFIVMTYVYNLDNNKLTEVEKALGHGVEE
jgi:GPH family glycoside/pentoside/hexuronide:cation symporter